MSKYIYAVVYAYTWPPWSLGSHSKPTSNKGLKRPAAFSATKNCWISFSDACRQLYGACQQNCHQILSPHVGICWTQLTTLKNDVKCVDHFRFAGTTQAFTTWSSLRRCFSCFKAASRVSSLFRAFASNAQTNVYFYRLPLKGSGWIRLIYLLKFTMIMLTSQCACKHVFNPRILESLMELCHMSPIALRVHSTLT